MARALTFFALVGAGAAALFKVCAPVNAKEALDPTLVADCEDVLSSFSVMPTFEQSAAERRLLLAMIYAAQLERHGDVCSAIPEWRQRFEQAYTKADDEVWQQDEAARDARAEARIAKLRRAAGPPSAECQALLDEYAAAFDGYLDQRTSKHDMQRSLDRLDQKGEALGCLKNDRYAMQHNRFVADAQLMGLKPSSGGALRMSE